ncbi:MAG: hypothetical protein ACI9R3_002364 [Verrucomicrobiales bacterium]|jgi:hypothetical protein
MSLERFGVVVVTALFFVLTAPADERAGALTPFLDKHCYECHDAESTKGDLSLENLSLDLADPDVAHLWTIVHDRLDRGEMPPKDADQPSNAERESFLGRLSGLLTDAHRAEREVVLRRLNRVEHEHTVRDLFGIDVFLQDMLPEDASAHGFDNIGEALSISTEQMQAYLEAADAVLDTSFGQKEAPKRIASTLNLRDIIDEKGDTKTVRIADDGVVLFNAGYNPSVLRTLNTPGPGLYQVRIKTKAVQSDKPVTMLVYGGVWGRRDKHIVGFFDIPPGEMTTVEFTDRQWERGDTFEIYPFDTTHRQTDPDNYDGPGLFVGDVHVEGPLETWPPPSRTKLLGEPDPTGGSVEDAARILGELLPRAFRRPVSAEDFEPILSLARGALDAGKPFETALRSALKGVLCSPEFLFLEESGENTVSDHALASRLSYFLWNSMPDAELFGLATDGRLRGAEVLRRQVERMLGDAKAKRFTENFTGQWLMLRDIDFTLPDRKLYPDYDELLKRSMVEESHRFFQEILDSNLSLTNFINSDFVFINERLARHYGIEGVTGQELQKIALPKDSVRGGVLTQASVLKVTANGTTTSPVTRGAWILDTILGRPSPPPPPGTPAVEPDIRGATTIREQLDKHRNVESCARCHRHIDPPGFALESFDVIGGWRDYYRTVGAGKWLERDPRYPHRHIQYRMGPDVDSQSQAANGEDIKDIRDYKRLLMTEKDQVARCLAEKLLTYALGRGLGFSDRPVVDSIVDHVKQHGYGFRTLIHEIVQSETFQSP